MSEPRDWDLLARYLAGEVTADEEQEVRDWIASDSQNQAMVQKLQASFSIVAPEDDASNLDALWSKISQEVARSKYETAASSSRQDVIDWLRRPFSLRPGFALRSLLVPAVLTAVLIALAWIPYHYIWTSPVYVSIEVPLGERLDLTLSDGTRIALDAGSRLRYPEIFEGNQRQVSLKGEGFFKVTHDENRPFVVTAAHGEVRVLGTAFNVRSWEDAGSVEVAVEEGRVSFGLVKAGTEQSVILGAGQASSLRQGATPSPPEAVDIERQLAWLRDEAFYENTPLSVVLDRLRRWHGTAIILSDSTLLHEHLTLHLSKSDPESSLQLVARLTASSLSRNGDTYYLSPH